MKRLFVIIVSCLFLRDGFCFKTKCYPVVGKLPFDEAKFSGDWYVVAAASTFPELKTVCNKANYKYENVGNVTRMHATVSLKLSDGKENTIEVKGQSFRPGMTSATHIAWKLASDQSFQGVAHGGILATDYDNYAVTSVCKEIYSEVEDMFTKLYVVSVLSRKPTLDHTIIDTLKSVLTSFDFDSSAIHDVDNSGC